MSLAAAPVRPGAIQSREMPAQRILTGNPFSGTRGFPSRATLRDCGEGLRENISSGFPVKRRTGNAPMLWCPCLHRRARRRDHQG
ncbi:hypothetical protein VTN02DRAFT_2433 [Thermoascus thermophilus]